MIGAQQRPHRGLADREERVAMPNLAIELDDPWSERIRALRHAHEQPRFAQLADVSIGRGTRVVELRGDVIDRPHRRSVGEQVEQAEHSREA